jgi:hypothetical protein
MPLTITRLTAPAQPKVTVNARLFRTADNKRLVGDGHPDAAFLFCTPGDEVDAEEFDRFDLDADVEAEPVPEYKTLKAEPPPEDKAVKAPPEDKGVVFPPETKREEPPARRKRRKR